MDDQFRPGGTAIAVARSENTSLRDRPLGVSAPNVPRPSWDDDGLLTIEQTRPWPDAQAHAAGRQPLGAGVPALLQNLNTGVTRLSEQRVFQHVNPLFQGARPRDRQLIVLPRAEASLRLDSAGDEGEDPRRSEVVCPL